MKCPKCKYITYDYLNTCPRCGKDLTAEKERLNISSIKPNSPFFLASLTGDIDEKGVETKEAGTAVELEEEVSQKEEEVFDDGTELDIDMDEGPIQEEVGETEEETEIQLDEGFGIEETASEGEEGVITEEPEEEPVKGLDDLELELDFGEEEEKEE